jgi:uncharacterized protein (DUF433 family)/predicted nuclease of predicted toxin-antitoxin system
MFERITFDHAVMGGRACVRGMRIPVSVVVNLLANGMSVEEILREYPTLEAEDIREALRYAASLAGEEVYLSFTRRGAPVKFLVDMGVSASTVRALKESGHDAIHAGEIGLDREPDRAILERGRTEGRIVLPFDLDFGDLLAAGGHALPSVIVFRLQDETPTSVASRLTRVIAERHIELSAGAIVVVEDARYRVRRLPI